MKSRSIDQNIYACLLILTAIALTGALIFTKSVLIPFVFSLFVYAVATPAVNFFQSRLKIPRAVSITLTILIFLSASVLLVILVVESIQDFILSAHIYRNNLDQAIEWITQVASKWGYSLENQSIRDHIAKLPVFGYARGLTGSVATFLGDMSLVVIFVLFLLIGENQTGKRNRLTQEIQAKVSRYVATKFLTSLTTGVFVGGVLSIFGVDLAFMFAVLTFLLNFIPNIGSIIATAIPVPVLLLNFGFGWQFPVILALLGSIQFLIGNVLEPKAMGENMDLHPVTILLFLMFWGLVWGLPGMFLAVPITAIIKIILSRIRATRTLAEILAGRLPH